jgi:hypothetical protein
MVEFTTELTNLADSSKEGCGSEGAVLPMMVMNKETPVPIE